MAIKDQPLYDLGLGEVEPKASPIARELGGVKPKATPAIRHLARELGVDLEKVRGTGKEGRITKEDVLGKISEDQVVPLHGIPLLMAKKMSESHNRVPAFSYFEQVDATRLIQLKTKIKEEGKKEGVSVTFMPFFIRALSLTLRGFPKVNSSYDHVNHSIRIHPHHNIGIAFSTAAGLVVPVLKNVETLTLQEIIREYAELKTKAQNHKLEVGDMREGTITISNYGSLSSGSLWATPVINTPEVAILALAKIHKQPIVVNDAIVIREMLNLSWTFDHRVVDGDTAAHFSHAFARLIANPSQLL